MYGGTVVRSQSTTSLLGSGCIAVKIAYLTVCDCCFSVLAPCYLQAILPTLILFSVSVEHDIDNFLRCFLSLFCDLFKQYCLLPVL